jgi:hypothetical protein
MIPRALCAVVAGLLVAAGAGSAPAQEVTAEVRTWSGESWTLGNPTLDVFYTIAPQLEDTPVGPAAVSSPEAGAAGSRSNVITFQIQAAPSSKRVPAIQARREAGVLALSRGGLIVRVPVDRIASLSFSRQAVAPRLPATMAPPLFRYGATAVLVDGSRIEADDVNLGTTVLRGSAQEGRIDLRWTEIEVIRFLR